MPRRSSRPRIPIRAMFPYVFRGSPIQPPSSKNPDIGFDKPAFRPRKSPTSQSANSPTLGYICTTIARNPAETSAAGLRKPAHPTGLTTFPAPAAGLRGSTLQSGLLKFPAPTRGAWARRRLAMRRRRGPRVSSRPEGRRLRPRARIPEESGQAGLDKSPQMWRQDNRIRRTNDGSRGPPARPGVMPAPGFAVPTSLLYHVFLEASR